MRTIRSRLTVWYATAVAFTLGAFALVIYLTQRSASYQELDRRVRSEAELTAGILAERYRAGGLLVRADTTGKPVLVAELAATLEAVPDFLVITHREGRVLFASAKARALTFEEFQRLTDAITAAVGGSSGGPLTLTRGPAIRYVVLPLTGAGPEFGTVLAAAPVQPGQLGLTQLRDTFLLVLPLGLIAAFVLGSWIARRALEPLDSIITEVREITDGRSLHRRLPEPMVKDELGRLAETVNQMLVRLERSFSALRRFTADASHELNTPLTVLRAGVERAITNPRLPPEALPLLEETMQEINRMTELLDTLLTLARADEGLAPLHKEAVDLRAIVDEARETGDLLAEQAGVAMAVRVPDQPVVAAVDRSRIRQLILNLLTNAVKYTPAGGSIRIELGGANGRVELTVADTGIGIAPGDLPHIFDRFWRADSARTRTGQRPGAGLGLAICKWIAEAHGGAIDVHSRPGRGTTFTVTLPG